MVRGATSVLVLALAWVCAARASVLIPTYVLPPVSFLRDQRFLDPEPAESQRTIKRLIGGHMKIKSEKDYGNPKNSIIVDGKIEGGKFVGEVSEPSGSTVGWNQGIWDDGMLMSSAGEGKDTNKVKEDDEDKKTLSDQVAEGKYGLIQDELFSKTPKRPGIVSYQPNAETRSKDNLQNLGGLKKEDIWLAEDHLLVLKGGSFPERTKEAEQKIWPPIDNYEAPRRQVKLPQKPKVPPPFPVQFSDDGPLVFLTPNGSVPAALFNPYLAGEGQGSLYPPPFLFPAGASDAQSYNPGNSSTGSSPMPVPPFPFLPGNATEGQFPYLGSINGSFPEGFPPGAAFLPPPSNQTDLYDEDDPSIYYPPPYNFSFHNDFKSNVPAGPLVPGIILPPPPDFFAPLEEKTTTTEEISTTYRPKSYTRTKIDTKVPMTTPSYRKFKTRPSTTDWTTTTEQFTTVTTPVDTESTTKYRKPHRIITSPPRNQIKVHNMPEEISIRPKVEKPVYKTRTKLTSKPLSVSVIYDFPEQAYEQKPTTSEKPYVVYNVPVNAINSIAAKDGSSTSVPVNAYYAEIQNDEAPTTKLQPVYNQKLNDDGLASFYFFDEKPKTSAVPEKSYYGRHYYDTNPQMFAQKQNPNSQNGFAPPSYSSRGQADALFIWPQKQEPHTLTQEYFSIQKPRPQQPKQRPNAFYQQIADIQQTIDLYTTKKPKSPSYRPYTNKPKPSSVRPVYQFNFETQPRPEKFTFRAPKLDPEPFRPMVSYSKPYNTENDFNTVSPQYHQQYLVENVQVTTENPTASRYYPKNKLREDYFEDVSVKAVPVQSNRNHIQVQTSKPVHQVNRYPSTTPNPISHGYYTKQDERYLDDITKNSFDVFGQKLEEGTHDSNGLAVTPPIGTVTTPIDNDINIKYAYEYDNRNPPSLAKDIQVNDRFPRPPVNPLSESVYAGHPSAAIVQQPSPPTLLGDTLVNDRLPRPKINPNSEFIPIPNPNYKHLLPFKVAQPLGPPPPPPPPEASELYDLNRPALGGDTDVNYRRPLPAVNPDAEWIPYRKAGEGRPGSLVSYRLPGDGAHVYFLTPQAAQEPRERYRTPGYGR